MNFAYHAAKGVHVVRTQRGKATYHFALANWWVRLGYLLPGAQSMLMAQVQQQLCRLYGADEGQRLIEETWDELAPLQRYLRQPKKAKG